MKTVFKQKVKRNLKTSQKKKKKRKMKVIHKMPKIKIHNKKMLLKLKKNKDIIMMVKTVIANLKIYHLEREKKNYLKDYKQRK